MAKIPGTNIDDSVLRGMDENKREEILARIENDIAAGDIAGANDALFSLAYHTGPKAGQGQGNPNVGKLQSGQWRLNEGETWAEQAVKSDSGRSDIYVQRDDQGNVKEDSKGRQVVIKGVDYGKPMTPDDISRSTQGSTYLYGTNIPTAGLTIPQINRLNARLEKEITAGNKDMAADALFEAVHALSKASGIDQDIDPAAYKQFMSQLYSDQFTFNPDTGLTGYADIVTKNPDKGTSDAYVQRNLDGTPRGLISGKDYTGSLLDQYTNLNNVLANTISSSGSSPRGLLDWSNLAPAVFGNPLSELSVATGLPAQRAMFGDKGSALQPWTQGLVNYTGVKPYTGDVTYTGGNPNLFNFNNNNQNNQNNTGQEWIGPEGETDFQRWGESEHARMYPGSQAMANASGFWGPMATRMNPAYRDYQQQNINQMISQGILPAGSTNYNSGNWQDWMDALAGKGAYGMTGDEGRDVIGPDFSSAEGWEQENKLWQVEQQQDQNRGPNKSLT